jgi:hypothetical protein
MERLRYFARTRGSILIKAAPESRQGGYFSEHRGGHHGNEIVLQCIGHSDVRERRIADPGEFNFVQLTFQP